MPVAPSIGDAENRRGRHREAVEAAGDGRPFLEHGADDAAERQGRDRQIQPAHAQRRPADRGAAQCGEQARRRQGDEKRHALRQQHRVDVGADAQERGVPQADQPSVADQQHQPDAGDGEDVNRAKFADVELAEDQGPIRATPPAARTRSGHRCAATARCPADTGFGTNSASRPAFPCARRTSPAGRMNSISSSTTLDVTSWNPAGRS